MHAEARAKMVDLQLARRGISQQRLLDAFRTVPREAFLPPELAEFAYTDAPLPIAEEQTISQPYIVALTVQSLRLEPHERVLEVGTGSGYAAAILSRLAREVYTVERHESLATSARQRLLELGFQNVLVLHGDGTLGWAEHAPYDAIAVAAGGPDVPEALLEQLAIGGRLVIPIGGEESPQVLTRVIRESRTSFRREPILHVRFVPLIGEQGWPAQGGARREKEKAAQPRAGARDEAPPAPLVLVEPTSTEPVPSDPVLLQPGVLERARRAGGAGRTSSSTRTLGKLVRESAEPLPEPNRGSLDALLERIGDARLVLLGECTHGTSEFYRLRARISRELIERRGFDFVAVEADWPDAARVDDYVLGEPARSSAQFVPFERFPRWMWRNRETLRFVDWLCKHNARAEEGRVGFHGLDLYSMFTSIEVVLRYLDEVDPRAARVARVRYGSLTPWQKDPAAYGHAVLAGRYQSSEDAVLSMLRELLEQRLSYTQNDGKRFFDAAQNARLVADAEGYYRAMYYGSAAAWNLRDSHMFSTLESLLDYYGPGSRGVVWAHNSHLGNAAATEMSLRGEHNIGQLCRLHYGPGVYAVGFGTDHGSVAAARAWGEPMERMRVRPAHDDSYERVCHEAGHPVFLLPLREPRRAALREELLEPRLERAIGVIYRPESELASHYFYASLPQQFDEYVWFDESRALEPLPAPDEDESSAGGHPLGFPAVATV